MKSLAKSFPILREFAELVPIIDCHDHTLKPGPKFLDPIHALVEGYFATDLWSVSSDSDIQYVLNSKIPWRERWPLFKELWDLAKHTGYGQVIKSVLREFYDIDKIKDFILTFSYTQLKNLCNYLFIEPIYLVYNIIDIIINDIISLEIDDIDNNFDKIPPELVDKIKENFEAVYHNSQIKFFKEEYYENIFIFREYFEKLDSTDQKIVKSRFQDAYLRIIKLPDFQNIINNIINLGVGTMLF